MGILQLLAKENYITYHKGLAKKLEENKANAIRENPFEQMQIQQQAFKISEYLSKIYGRTISFEIQFVPKKVEEKKQEIPTEVKILRDVFKGTITVGA